MKPNRIKPQRAPKRYGIHDVKSYFVWQAKRVRKTKIPPVRNTALSTMEDL